MAEATMTLYDTAKQLAANESPMDPIIFNKKIDEVSKKMKKKYAWMLLCRERNDYTVFLTDNATQVNISEELSPTLRNRGQILLIDEQPDGAFEIWIRDPETQENFAYYLFDYSNGIIDCDV